MLTMRPRFATGPEWFRREVPRHPPHAVFLMNRDESEWIGMSVIPRFIPNAHEWPRLHLPHLKYEPGAATVELRFRPRPQSTTIQPECFKRFKTAVASSRSISWRYLESPRFFSNYYSTTTIHADVSTVLLRIIPIHHNLIQP